MKKIKGVRRLCVFLLVLAMLGAGFAAQAKQVTCALCGGTGSSICMTCGGVGTSSCIMCGGVGLKSSQTWSVDPITGASIPSTTLVPCTSCGGSGKVFCINCSGMGRKTCSLCGGSGRIDDGDNSGSGSGSSGSGSDNSGSDGSGSSGQWTGPLDPGVPYAMAHGTVLAGTRSNYEWEGVKYLFDGEKDTKYCTVTTSLFVIWKAPRPIAVNGYVIMTGNDNSIYNGRNPRSWALYGSTQELPRDSGDWNVIHKVTNDKKLRDVDYTNYTFKVDPAARTYQYFKLEIFDNCGDGCIQMSEFTLKGTESDTMEEETPQTATVTVDGLKYKLDDKAGTAAFIGPAQKTAASIVIPNAIRSDGRKYKVTGISAGACKGLKKLTSVSIGKYVTVIDQNAFSGCKKLKTVIGGEKVKTIGKAAFKNDAALKKFTVYAKVKTIGDEAFYGCKKLKTLVIKSTKLTDASVGANAFKNTYKKMTVDCPKAKLKAYRKLLAAKGAPKKAVYR